MLDYGFKIKVADLLQNPGTKDEIQFENKITTQIENITKEGIKGTIKLQSLNKNTVHVALKDIQATMEELCDKCGKNFTRNIRVKNFEGRFVLVDDIHIKNEDDFEINPKDETIDIEDLVYQSLTFQEPIVKICDECIPLQTNIDDEDEEFETKVNIKKC